MQVKEMRNQPESFPPVDRDESIEWWTSKRVIEVINESDAAFEEAESINQWKAVGASKMNAEHLLQIL